MRIPSSMYGTYFSQRLDAVNRKIFLIEDINDQALANFTLSLKFLEAQDSKPITIYIATEGGEIESMFGIFDMMRDSKCQIITVGLGKILSAGVLLLAAGDKRFCYPHTCFMVHAVSLHAPRDCVDGHKERVRMTEIQQNIYFKCLEKQTRISSKTWSSMANKNIETYFDAERAKALHLVHKIL